jgi:hypothetical protein
MRIHTTTRNPGTYIRLFCSVIASVAFVMLVPYLGATDESGYFSFIAVNVGILYAITIGFLMMLAITRKQSLDAAISLELNKIRRLHHLALNLHKVTPGTDAWYKATDKAIIEYLRSFESRDFMEYEKGDKFARKMTYAIYELPQTVSEYNGDLYGELLGAAASITESRENIRSTKDASIGYFQWAVTVGMTTVFAFITMVATPMDMVPRVLSGIGIFYYYLMLQLIYEYDQTNPKKRRFYIDSYLENAKRMK